MTAIVAALFFSYSLVASIHFFLFFVIFFILRLSFTCNMSSRGISLKCIKLFSFPRFPSWLIKFSYSIKSRGTIPSHCLLTFHFIVFRWNLQPHLFDDMWFITFIFFKIDNKTYSLCNKTLDNFKHATWICCHRRKNKINKLKQWNDNDYGYWKMFAYKNDLNWNRKSYANHNNFWEATNAFAG